jgi:hypothetical protein
MPKVCAILKHHDGLGEREGGLEKGMVVAFHIFLQKIGD